MKRLDKPFEKKQTKLLSRTIYETSEYSRKFWKIITAFFRTKEWTLIKWWWLRRINCYHFVDISKSLHLRDYSKSNVYNTGSNCGHSDKNVLFEDHVSVKIIREKKEPDHGEFRLHPISTDELKKIVIGLDCNKSNLKGGMKSWREIIFCVRHKNSWKHSKHFKLWCFKLNSEFATSD